MHIENLIERGVMIMDIVIGIAIFLISAVIFTFVGVYIRKKTAESKIQSAEQEAKKILDSAKKDAERRMQKAMRQKIRDNS